MADSAPVAANVGDRLKAIADRLKQISTYKFLPPSVMEEKKQLEEEQQSLQNAGTSDQPNGSQGGSSDSGTTQQSQTPTQDATNAPTEVQPASQNTEQPAGNNSGEQAQPEQTNNQVADQAPAPSDQSQIWKTAAASSDKIVLPMGSTPAASNPDGKISFGTTPSASNIEIKEGEGLIGTDYALEGDEKPAPPADEPVSFTPTTKRDFGASAPAPTQEKKSEPSQASGKPTVTDSAKQLVEAIGRELDSANTPDRAYLKTVLDDLAKTVAHLEERASAVKMDEPRKSLAIKGRLKTYLDQLRAELEFSEVLNVGISKLINDFISN